MDRFTEETSSYTRYMMRVWGDEPGGGDERFGYGPYECTDDDEGDQGPAVGEFKQGELVSVRDTPQGPWRLAYLREHAPYRRTDGWYITWTPAPPEHQSQGGWQPVSAIRRDPEVA